MEHYTEYLDRAFKNYGYNDSSIIDDNALNNEWQTFEKRAEKFFRNLTPNDAAYYSDEIIEYRPDVRNTIRDFLKTHTWQENLDYYFDRSVKGMRLCNATDLLHTRGNGRPDQFGFYSYKIISNSFAHYVYDVLSSLKLESTDSVKFHGNYFNINRDLGFGHKASAYFEIDLNVYTKSDHKFGFTPYIKVSHDNGFFDELDTIKEKVKADIQLYKKKSKFLKTKIY